MILSTALCLYFYLYYFTYNIVSYCIHYYIGVLCCLHSCVAYISCLLTLVASLTICRFAYSDESN